MFDMILAAVLAVAFAALAYGNRDATSNFGRFLFNAQMLAAGVNGAIFLAKLGVFNG